MIISNIQYLLVTMMTSSAMLANSLIAKYTILRSITYNKTRNVFNNNNNKTRVAAILHVQCMGKEETQNNIFYIFYSFQTCILFQDLIIQFPLHCATSNVFFAKLLLRSKTVYFKQRRGSTLVIKWSKLLIECILKP